MKKKLLSIAAACVLGVQAIAMPMIANAEQGTHYVEKRLSISEQGVK